MKPIHNLLHGSRQAAAVANNPNLEKMKPIHNCGVGRIGQFHVANNPNLEKMKPIHNYIQLHRLLILLRITLI